jgi:hypothetical protein
MALFRWPLPAKHNRSAAPADFPVTHDSHSSHASSTACLPAYSGQTKHLIRN